MAPANPTAVQTPRCSYRRGVRDEVGVSIRPTSIGPAGAICAIIGATIFAPPLAHVTPVLVTLALLTAALLLVAAVPRIALLERLFPEPIRIGVIAGTGITVVVAESTDLVLNGTASLRVGAGSLVLLGMLKRFGLRGSAPLLVLALATVSSAGFDLERHGVRVIGSALSGFAPAFYVLGQLPLATISALLVVVCLGWIDARRLSELRQASPRDFRIALVAAFGVTILGPRWAVAIGVATALGETFRRALTNGARRRPRLVAPRALALGQRARRRGRRRRQQTASLPLAKLTRSSPAAPAHTSTLAPSSRRCCSPTRACRGRARVR